MENMPYMFKFEGRGVIPVIASGVMFVVLICAAYVIAIDWISSVDSGARAARALIT